MLIRCKTSLDNEEVICVSIDFKLPLTVTHRLHTCNYRKFVGVNITCHTDWSLALKNLDIVGISQPSTNSDVKLIPLNTNISSLIVSI